MASESETIWEGQDKWFVWTKTGRNPKFVHDTREAASAEAERLAVLHPGKKFHVLHAVSKVGVVSAPAPIAQAIAA